MHIKPVIRGYAQCYTGKLVYGSQDSPQWRVLCSKNKKMDKPISKFQQLVNQKKEEWKKKIQPEKDKNELMRAVDFEERHGDDFRELAKLKREKDTIP